MTHEQWLEERMVEWLVDGPVEVPAKALDDAVAYARAHPQPRRLSWWTGRSRPGHAGWRGAPRGRSQAFAMLGATGLAVVVVVAGGILVGMPFGRPEWGGPGSGGPTATPASPTASRSASPRETAAPIPVAGTWTCEEASPGVATTVDQVVQHRGTTVACTGSMPDPRLAGSMRLVQDADEHADGGAETWGTATLTTTSGSWSGWWAGSIEAGSGLHRMTGVIHGWGRLDGLRLRFTMASTADGFTMEGTIEDAGSVPPEGSTVVFGHICDTTSAGTTTRIGDITRYGNVALTCSGRASDPRLDGTYAMALSIDERPDESATMRGTFTIRNAAGAWTGDWIGTVDRGYTTHRAHGLLVGSGAYAGLTWPITVIGTTTGGYVAIGAITPAD